MRVVSLTCSNTEIVAALGLSHLLVGVDDHSDFPADVVARLPRVGPDLGIDVGRVTELSPDLVLASLTVPGHERVVERLAEAKLPYVATEPVSVADVYADVRLIGGLLGVASRAEEVVRAMQAELAPCADAFAPRPSVLVEWWPKPVIAPGKHSWVTDLLGFAGGRGVLDDANVKSRSVTDDEVAAWDPDCVVIAWCGVPFHKYRPDVVRRRPAWAGLRAVRHDRIYCVPEAYLGRPSPRLLDGVRALRKIVAELSSATPSAHSSGRPSTSSS